jgi:hypothetical protein
VISCPDLPGNIGLFLNPSQGKTGRPGPPTTWWNIPGTLAAFWLWFILALCHFFFL